MGEGEGGHPTLELRIDIGCHLQPSDARGSVLGHCEELVTEKTSGPLAYDMFNGRANPGAQHIYFGASMHAVALL